MKSKKEIRIKPHSVSINDSRFLFNEGISKKSQGVHKDDTDTSSGLHLPIPFESKLPTQSPFLPRYPLPTVFPLSFIHTRCRKPRPYIASAQNLPIPLKILTPIPTFEPAETHPRQHPHHPRTTLPPPASTLWATSDHLSTESPARCLSRTRSNCHPCCNRSRSPGRGTRLYG